MAFSFILSLLSRIALLSVATASFSDEVLPTAVLPAAKSVGQSEAAELRQVEGSGPYCGLYSLWACLTSLGVTYNASDLISVDYVGSAQGSSALELIKAAEASGVHAKAFVQLGISDLKRAGTPLILHTRGNDGSRKYQHWIAFLGADGDKARILDAPHELETISFAELLANWDGLALAISTSPISDSLIDEARFDYIVSATAVVIAVYLFKRIRRTKTDLRVAISWQRRVAQSCGQIAVLVFVASAVGLIYHGTADIGFLNNPSAVAEVTRRYYSVDIPERSLAEVNASIENADAILVDARMSLDFRSGALPGAVSISVDSTLPERQRALGKISRSFPIIVYCQSSGCTYSDEVARFLKFNGYTRVSIYRGGFQEWQKQQHHPGDRAKTVEHEDVPEVGGNS